ncbi:hypothetical protein DV738_g4718, partial [Chaetothyriales sp. CBS 135597]
MASVLSSGSVGINNKLQLYGIYSAFAKGKVPSNKQIDVALNSALASKALTAPSPQLSADGKDLITDTREVIRQAKYLLLSKNEGNLLQEFIWDTQHLEHGDAKLPSPSTDKDTAQQHKNELLDGLKTLGSLILSNGQFRKLLSDSTILLREIVGDAATQVASKVGPSEDQLAQVDDPAEDNTWYDAPDLSKQRLRDTYNKNKPFSRDQSVGAVQQGVDAAQSQTDAQTGVQEGAATAGDNLTQQAQANVPAETQENVKQTTNQYLQSSKAYIDKKVPQERRDQAIYRLKKMIVEIQGHSDYQQAVETLLSLAETYTAEGQDLARHGAGTVKGAFEDKDLKRVETDLKTLIERFANYTSTDDLFDSIRAVYTAADHDPELRNWFKSLNKFIRRALQDQGYILQDSATEEWNALQDKGHYLARERYRSQFDHVLDEFKFFNHQFEQDPQNRAFAQAIEKLFLDLGRDHHGKIEFKPHLVKDVTEVILPSILENVRYIPIPRIEVSDPNFDAVVENIVIESDNLFPNVAEFATDHYTRLGRGHIKNRHDNKIRIAVSGIQADIRDVAYYIKKKQGFPSLTDRGVLDIFLGGDGFSFKLAARNAQDKDRSHFVVVDKVEVSVKHLVIKIKKSNHKLLFTIAKSILINILRPLIQKVLEKEIKSNFEKADAAAWAIHQDAQKAIEAAKADPENAQNIFSHYEQAWQKRLTQKQKTKKHQKSSETVVNVSFTQHDSIFPHIKLPGGITTKATEYKELAAKGERWESPVFSIGNAKESTDIPKHIAVIRRPHGPPGAGGAGGAGGYGSTGPAGSVGAAGAGANPNQYGSGLPATTTTAPTTGFTGSADGGTSLSQEVDQAFHNAANATTTKPVGITNDFRTFLSTAILSDQQNISYRSLSRALKCHVNIAKCLLYEYYEEQNKRKAGSVYATYMIAGTRKPGLSVVETNGSGGSGSGVNGQKKNESEEAAAASNGDDHDDIMDLPSSLPPFSSSMLDPSQSSQDTTTEARPLLPAAAVKTVMLVRQEELESAKSQYEEISGIHIYSLSPGKIADLVALTDIGRGLFADVFSKEDPLLHNKTYGVIQNQNARANYPSSRV